MTKIGESVIRTQRENLLAYMPYQKKDHLGSGGFYVLICHLEAD